MYITCIAKQFCLLCSKLKYPKRKSLKMQSSFSSTSLHPNLHDAALHECSLYVHWPYCEKRCTYCNFNKYIERNVDHETMTKCLIAELKSLLSESGAKITTVFFGGGTPSLMKPQSIEAILSALMKSADWDPSSEVTLECNPAKKIELKDFKLCGVNRISVGFQTLSDKGLNVLGRTHSTTDSLNCLEQARRVFPGRTSLDLIYGRPNQTLQEWNNELQEVVQLSDGHISLYELTLERGTSLFRDVQKGSVTMPPKDNVAEMYLKAVQVLERNGFHRYEVSNFAKVGCESEHNKNYWNGRQYIGIGPGAHGRFIPFGLGKFEREARIQTLEPDNWMKEVCNRGHGTRKIIVQTLQDVLEELLMLGLRTSQGLLSENWNVYHDKIMIHDVFGHSPKVQKYVREGFVQVTERSLTATPKGMSIADTISSDFLPLIEDFLRQYS